MDWERMKDLEKKKRGEWNGVLISIPEHFDPTCLEALKHSSTGYFSIEWKSKLRSSKPKHVVLKAGLKAQLWSNWTRQQNLKLTSSIERPFRPATHQWPSSLYWQRRKASHIHAHTHTETLTDGWDHTLRLSLLGQPKLVQSGTWKSSTFLVKWLVGEFPERLVD